MEAKELRIGNLVFDCDGQISEVIGIHKEGSTRTTLLNINDQTVQHVSVLKPIPLTEEWVLKLGFKGRVDKGCTEESATKFLDDKIWWNNGHVRIKDHRYYPVEFVHKLQNLIYENEGIELEIKL